MAVVFTPGVNHAQMLSGAPADPNYKYSTPMPRGIAIPPTLETRLGTLRIDGGVPDTASTDRLLDNLDFQAPDARMKRILTEAAAVDDATARAIAYRMRDRAGYIFDNANWRYAFFGGYRFEWQPGVANLDAAAFFFFLATGVTPAMDTTIVGEGSTYPWTALDSRNRPLDGGKNYKLRLPPNVPAKTFWSVIVYNTQTRSMQQSNQRFPSVSSQDKKVQKNADGSFDVYFGPKAPAGKESNWIQSVPGQTWFTILRLYGPLEPWFNKTWRPGEIELQP